MKILFLHFFFFNILYARVAMILDVLGATACVCNLMIRLVLKICKPAAPFRGNIYFLNFISFFIIITKAKKTFARNISHYCLPEKKIYSTKFEYSLFLQLIANEHQILNTLYICASYSKRTHLYRQSLK